MKILFYDIKDFELNYFLDKIPNDVEPYFFKELLNNNTPISKEHSDCEAISTFVGSVLSDEVLSKFPNLKFIFLRCAGYSNVDLQYCKNNNINVFNTPDYGNSTVAEYAFTLLLALCKKIIPVSYDIKEGKYDCEDLMGIELKGKTLGVVGAGAIGRKVINIALSFGLDVLAYDPAENGAYNFVPFEELVQKSDFISIHCPLNSLTKGMFNTNTIALMKKNAIIVNTARGEIIETEPLYNALVNKKIQGAALDVIECEEMLCQTRNRCEVDDDFRQACAKKFLYIEKLLKLDNVIITPHNAYNTYEAQVRILKITLDNIRSSFNIDAGAKNLVLL